MFVKNLSPSKFFPSVNACTNINVIYVMNAKMNENKIIEIVLAIIYPILFFTLFI